MDLKPNSMYETANEAVLLCHAYLLEEGERDAAGCLEGLCDIHDERTADKACDRIRAATGLLMRPSSAKYLLVSALHAVERLLPMQLAG